MCHVTTILKCHVTAWGGPLILSHQLAKYGFIGLVKKEI